MMYKYTIVTLLIVKIVAVKQLSIHSFESKTHEEQKRFNADIELELSFDEDLCVKVFVLQKKNLNHPKRCLKIRVGPDVDFRPDTG